jgi:hypothetical protein
MTQSRKHAPRVDDELERQAEAHLKGAPPGGRAEEWREPEPPAEGEPEVGATPQADDLARSDADLHLTPRDIEERSRFSRYLARSAFPAKRKELLRAAREAGAPDDILEDLRRLPTDRIFETPARAWAALGHKIDQRF